MILAWVGGISALIAIAGFIRGYVWMQITCTIFCRFFQQWYHSCLFLLIVLGGLYKKIDVFDAFVEGAKGGFETAVRIIPYIVGMLVAISMLRTSGTFDVIINGSENHYLLRWVPIHVL